MPTRFASTALVGFEIVEPARRAPRPGAQRAPVVGLARLALVDQADDPFRQAGAVVRLNARRADRRVAPASGDQLLRGRRIASGRRRLRVPGRAASERAAAEHHHHRHWPRRVRGSHERHLNVDVDRRIRGVVDVPDSCLPMTGCAPAIIGVVATRSTSPSGRSAARGRAPRARSPRRSRRGAASTTPSESSPSGRSSASAPPAGRETDSPSPRRSWRDWAPLVAARAGPQLRDAQLLHHVVVILRRRPRRRLLRDLRGERPRLKGQQQKERNNPLHTRAFRRPVYDQLPRATLTTASGCD